MFFASALVCAKTSFFIFPSLMEVLQKGAAGHWEAFQRALGEEDGGLQLLGLLLLLLDLRPQGIAEGLGQGTDEGESRLALLLLGFSHLDS